MIAYKILPAGMSVDNATVRSWGVAATGNYFDVLGVQPALGHFFHASDEHGLGSAPYVVLSYDFWRRQFGARSDVLGKTVKLNGHPFTVIGVARQGFRGNGCLLLAGLLDACSECGTGHGMERFLLPRPYGDSS